MITHTPQQQRTTTTAATTIPKEGDTYQIEQAASDEAACVSLLRHRFLRGCAFSAPATRRERGEERGRGDEPRKCSAIWQRHEQRLCSALRSLRVEPRSSTHVVSARQNILHLCKMLQKLLLHPLREQLEKVLLIILKRKHC